MKKLFNFRLLVLIGVLIMSVSQMWATDYYLRYQKNMPEGKWDGDTSEKLTQFGSTNRYYCELELSASSSYGYFIREDDSDTKCYKADATASTNQEISLSSYNGQHGGSSHRVTYTTGSAGTYIFTYDINNHKISVSPKSSLTVKVAWSTASGHDGDYNLETYTTLSQEGSTAKYSADVDLTAVKHYMFVQTDGNRYWKNTAEVTAGSYAYVYDYGTDNYGGSSNKNNFTPSVAGKYRFIWDHDAKMVTYARLYTVAYDGNDNTSGDAPATSYHLSGSTVTVASNSGTLAKTGYLFGGWNTENDGSGDNYTAGSGTFTKAASAETLYAQWNATITLDKNGGSANGSATTMYKSDADLDISAPTNTTGYHVVGYYAEAGCSTLVADEDGKLVANIDGFTDEDGRWVATAAKTLYAKWSNEYTVTFNQHEPTIHGTKSTTATYGFDMPAVTIPRKDGYIFGGYYTEAGGSGTKYYDEIGASAHICDFTSNTTLHAKWTGISYQVAFDGNGATVTKSGEDEMDKQDMTYNSSSALTANDYTRDGYFFLGWNTNADGSGTAYYDGKTVENLTNRNGGVVTLYAQWAQLRTLHFLNMGVSGWDNKEGDQAGTIRYAYAEITYDGHTMYPLGEWSSNVSQGTRMTAEDGIKLTNVNNGMTTWCWYIDDVPEGAMIKFSDNDDDNKSGDQSNWTADKPYFCNANSTWYALDGDNKIDKMTEMSVYIGKGHFGNSWQFFALDKHDSTYANISLNKDQTYQYKYYNWRTNTYSGATGDDAYIINGSSTTADYGGSWSLNGTKDVMLKTNSHASGEYKFMLIWSGGTPQSKVYIPRGVNLTTTSPVQALAGSSVTVSFQADAWTNISSDKAMSHPTYYFEFSTDESNWTTVATVAPESDKMQATASYTFTARSGYFRVKLVNDHGIASYSGSTAFTAYTTKSFYVYNPWVAGSWSTLYLYTKNSSSGTEYNGAWPGGHDTESCENGNNIINKGNGWYYITIDERADEYKFSGDVGYETEYCYVSNYIQDAKYMLYWDDAKNTVTEYVAKGASDYRLKYTDSGHERYSDIYNTTLDGTTVTTSMWMNADDATASLVIQQADGENSWEDQKEYSNSEKDGFEEIIDEDHLSHGYVFQMQINFNTDDPTASTVSDVKVYDGLYYVRTDGLTGGWNDYKRTDHTMFHSENSLTSGTPAFDHYLCKWIGSEDTNVKFTIANEYNSELVESLEGDVNSTDPLYNRQTVPTPTNVRFAWNSRTNTLTRSYLSATTDVSSRFLVMAETTSTPGKIFNESGQSLTTGQGRVAGLEEHELLFADKGNWVYELVIQANPGAEAKVTAKYNEKESEFIPSTKLIGGDGDSQYKYRIVYDFKTNILTNAWVADGSKIIDDIELNTNIMLIRNGQDPATQLTFNTGKSITETKKMIGVMEFEYDEMVGRMSSWNSTAYQKCMYYFSFPFKVKVSDIFGVGEMGTDWRIQKYNGAKRAEIGWFAADGTTTFWEDVLVSDTLHPYEGYSLLLNRINFNNGSSDVWSNTSSGGAVYLYFPSLDSNVGSIASQSQTVTVPSHICNINRWFTQDLDENGEPIEGARNHKITDSNWNMLGSALFEDKTGSTITPNAVYGTTLNYIYSWNSSDNTLSARATLNTSHTFDAMHAYLVQFAGTVTFSGASITPHIAARQIEETKNYMIELELTTEEKFAGRTYVELRETAVDSFLLNEDMYMLKNSKTADVYTFAGGYDVAANVLTVNNHIVPVGMNVKKEGTYTFSMPSYFSGIVTLVDTYNNTRTNLTMEDYEVYLNKGTIDDRFLLEISINNAPTAIDGAADGEGSLKDGKAHKFIQDGQMYILQNGVVYDARGSRVK